MWVGLRLPQSPLSKPFPSKLGGVLSPRAISHEKIIRLSFKNPIAFPVYRLWLKSNHRRNKQEQNNKPKKDKTMKTKTNIKVGATYNHNETRVRPQAKRSLKLKTQIKAGVGGTNHNETLVRA